MTILVPVNVAQFQRYLQVSSPEFAEEKVRAGQWALHVVGHNPQAQALYVKLGYISANITMFEALA